MGGCLAAASEQPSSVAVAVVLPAGVGAVTMLAAIVAVWFPPGSGPVASSRRPRFVLGNTWLDVSPVNRNYVWRGTCEWSVTGGTDTLKVVRATLRKGWFGKPVRGKLDPVNGIPQNGYISAAFDFDVPPDRPHTEPPRLLRVRRKVTLVDDGNRHYRYSVPFEGER